VRDLVPRSAQHLGGDGGRLSGARAGLDHECCGGGHRREGCADTESADAQLIAFLVWQGQSVSGVAAVVSADPSSAPPRTLIRLVFCTACVIHRAVLAGVKLQSRSFGNEGKAYRGDRPREKISSVSTRRSRLSVQLNSNDDASPGDQRLDRCRRRRRHREIRRRNRVKARAESRPPRSSFSASF